jgi:hypothetical protein
MQREIGYKIDVEVGGQTKVIDFRINEPSGGGKGNVEPEMPQPPKDDTIPTITISPTSATVCKTTSITITVEDIGSGLSSDNNYQWQLGTSSTTAPTGTWTTYTSGTAFTAGTGLTGTYYLWVKQISDNEGNKSVATIGSYTVAGTYIFDNTAPTVDARISPSGWANEKTITINATDVGSAGLHSTAYNFDEEGYQSLNSKSYTENGAKTIKVQDKLGNEQTVIVDIEMIDRTIPTITISPTNATVCKEKSITITVEETGGGLSSSNSYQWQMGTSSTTAPTGTWTTYTSGTAFTAGTGLTGTYYLWVKQVSDNAGNKSVTTTGSYTVAGTYIFDNTAPTVAVSPTSQNATATSVTVSITATDANSGVSEVKAYWSTSSIALTTDSGTWNSATTVSLSGSSGTSSRTGSTTSSLSSTSLYLQLRVKDVAGNSIVSVYGPYNKRDPITVSVGMIYMVYDQYNNYTVSIEILAPYTACLNRSGIITRSNTIMLYSLYQRSDGSLETTGTVRTMESVD